MNLFRSFEYYLRHTGVFDYLVSFVSFVIGVAFLPITLLVDATLGLHDALFFAALSVLCLFFAFGLSAVKSR